MSNSKKPDPTDLIRKSYRRSTRHFQAHMKETFILFSVFREMEKQLGRDGLQTWMQLHCPEITWAEVELVLSHVSESPLNAHIAKQISKN